MSQPIAIDQGIAFAFPDVCNTPAPPSAPIPIPYPNIAMLSDANPKTDESGKELLIGPNGNYALLQGSTINTSTGNEAGSNGGLTSGTTRGKCEITTASTTVLYGSEGKGLARFMDPTSQNDGNAVGNVLSAFPQILVGG